MEGRIYGFNVGVAGGVGRGQSDETVVVGGGTARCVRPGCAGRGLWGLWREGPGCEWQGRAGYCLFMVHQGDTAYSMGNEH